MPSSAPIPKNPWKNGELLLEHLEAICKAAREEEVHLLVFPELTVDAEALRHVSEILRKTRGLHPYGVIAGSFHSWAGERKAADDWNGPLPHNELVLLDDTGARLATHRKRGRFRIFSKFLKQLSVLFPGTPADSNGRPLEIFEGIEYGAELQILDTTLGRIAFLICADAIAPDDRGYLPLVRRLRPDLLIVVAMSHQTEPFDAFAEDMSGHWIGTLVVNAFCICQATESLSTSPRNLAQFDLALFERKDSAPTRVRWCYGGREAECRYFKSADGNKEWQTALPPTGVSWLGGLDKKLGLVLNLGLHIPPDSNSKKTKNRA